jgi:hypothetical protein
MEETFKLFLSILSRMRCSPPDLTEIMMNDAHRLVAREIEWRGAMTPTAWTPTALSRAMTEWRSHGLRWESVSVSPDVASSPEYQVSEGS